MPPKPTASGPSRKSTWYREHSCALIARREEGAYLEVCNRRATQRAGMQERSNTVEFPRWPAGEEACFPSVERSDPGGGPDEDEGAADHGRSLDRAERAGV